MTHVARQVVSLIVFVLALPLVFLGLIDPLEGGIALLAALTVYLVGFGVAGHWPSTLLWIPFVAAVVVGGITLGYAILTNEPGPGPGRNLPILMAGVWAYRVAVIATLVGGVLTVWQSVQRIRGAAKTPDRG